ncbi:MAG: DUF4868 domain-containing protein [Phascolarctobacterium sp.]|nr:DUF4868 domain-containing protein [Phascolarctobacterium sp.]
MLKDEVISCIKSIMNSQFGFEAYVVCRDKEDNSVRYLRKFILDNEKIDGKSFRDKVCQKVISSITYKFCNDESIYASAFDIANRQKNMYVIPQTNEYRPFAFLDDSIEEAFSVDLTNKAEGIVFCFKCAIEGEIQSLWAYQNFSNFTIPNRKGGFLQTIFDKCRNEKDAFVEFKKQLFIITDRIDILILNGDIITDNIGLLERSYGFEEFIRSSGMSAVNAIVTAELVNDDQKLKKYVGRTEKRYARKMMQIQQYPVIRMDKDSLFKKLKEVDRWKDVFTFNDNKIVINNYKDVDNLIDLLVERFTKSEISGQEYDTDVKKAI